MTKKLLYNKLKWCPFIAHLLNLPVHMQVRNISFLRNVAESPARVTTQLFRDGLL